MARLVLFLIIVGVMIYALVDCLRAPESYIRGPRYAWITAIIVLPLLGAVLYLTAGRELIGNNRAGSLPGRPKTVAPDDDPDFLRSLDTRPPTERPDDDDAAA